MRSYGRYMAAMVLTVQRLSTRGFLTRSQTPLSLIRCQWSCRQSPPQAAIQMLRGRLGPGSCPPPPIVEGVTSSGVGRGDASRAGGSEPATSACQCMRLLRPSSMLHRDSESDHW